MRKGRRQCGGRGSTPHPDGDISGKKLGLAGGIIITASHNPENCNGLKFALRGGQLIDEKRIEELADIIKNLKEDWSGQDIQAPTDHI